MSKITSWDDPRLTNWAQDNNNAAKEAATRDAPVWVKYGYPDTPEGKLAFMQRQKNGYEMAGVARPPAPAQPGPAPAPVPGLANPTATQTGPYDNSTAFGQYLNSHPNRGDAWAQLEAMLKDLQLEGADVSELAKQAFTQDLSNNEVYQRLRETSTWKTRYKAIGERERLGLPPISENDVLGLERQYRAIAQQAGLPTNFYDQPEDFVNFITRDISPSEYQDRIIDGYSAVRNDPRIQSQMQRLYGIGLDQGDLVAYYLDPDRAVSALQKRQGAAALAARSVNSGYGNIDATEAEGLYGRGVTTEQAQKSFSALAGQRMLFTPLAGEIGDFSRQEQLASAFDSNAPAQQRLERRRQERQADFQGGGSYQTTKSGKTAAGSAS